MTRVSPRAILAIGWLVLALYAYPGYMTGDAIDELIDSRYGTFTDWHSPVMTEVWRLVGIFVSGPAGMLILQGTLLLLGAYHLFRRGMTDRAAAIAACGTLVFPPVIATMGVICPESQLAGFLLAGLVALGCPRRAVKIAGLGAILIAIGMRPGGALAALPVVVLGFVWRADQRRLVRYALATAVWVGITACAAGLNVLVVDGTTDRPAVWLAGLDLAGTVAQAGPIDDAELRDQLGGLTIVVDHDLQGHVRQRYATAASIMEGAERVFDAPETEAGKERLLAARRSLALAHPGAYLAHRWHVFVRELGLSRGKRWRPVWTEFVGHPDQRFAVHHSARHAPPQRWLIWIVRAVSHGALFRPVVYLAIALILLPLAIRRRHPEAVMLLASGIAYELSLFVVTLQPEYRDSHWMIVSTLLAVVLMIARGARSRRAAPDDPRSLG